MTYLRDIQRQKARSGRRGRGYGSEVLYFGDNNKNVAITINEHIAGNYVPDLIQFVSETPLAILLHKPDSGHVGVYHNLRGGGGIGYANLSEESSSHRPWPSARPYAVPFQKESHLLGPFQIALHVVGKVGGAHRRLLRFGDFPHLAFRRLLVKLI